jgi:hypothetical protein
VLPRQEAFPYCHRIGNGCVDIAPPFACISPRPSLFPRPSRKKWRRQPQTEPSHKLMTDPNAASRNDSAPTAASARLYAASSIRVENRSVSSPLANGVHTNRGDDLAAIAAAATATPEVFLAGVARKRTVLRPILTGPCLPLVERKFGSAKCTLGSTLACITARRSNLQVEPSVSNSMPLSSKRTDGIGVVLSLNNYSLRTAGHLSQNRTYLTAKNGD